MRHRNKILAITILAFFAADLLYVNVAFAQEITQAALQQQAALDTAWLRADEAGKPAALQAATTNCRDLGATLYSISQGSGAMPYSTMWIDQEGCRFGYVRENSASESPLGRRLYSVGKAESANQLYAFVFDGQGILNRQNLVSQINSAAALYNKDQGLGIKAATAFFGGIINWGLVVVRNFLGLFVGWAGKLLAQLTGFREGGVFRLGPLTYTKYVMQSPDHVFLDRAWGVVRDFMNMFFIIALIAIALGTILRIERYDYRRLLVRLIIMALLVNFSKVIAETLITFFDNLMGIFAAQADFSNANTLSSNLMSENPPDLASLNGIAAQVVQALWTVIIFCIVTVAYLVLAILLFIRFIGLMLLVVISPVAYALNIIPETQSFARQWWERFFKYLIWGPVAIFVLVIAQAITVQAGDSVRGSNTYIIIAAFYIGAVMVAKAAGAAGAAGTLALVNKGVNRAKSYSIARGKGMAAGVARGGYVSAPGRLLQRIGESERFGINQSRFGKRLASIGTGAQAVGKKLGAPAAIVAGRFAASREKREAKERDWKTQVNTRANDYLAKRGFGDAETAKGFNDEQYKEWGKRMAAQGKDGLAKMEKVMEESRKATDAFLKAFIDGSLDKSIAVGGLDKNVVKESIYKSSALKQGIREHEWNQNKDTYIKQSEVYDNEAEQISKGQKPTKNRKVYIKFPTRDEVSAISDVEKVRGYDRKQMQTWAVARVQQGKEGIAKMRTVMDEVGAKATEGILAALHDGALDASAKSREDLDALRENIYKSSAKQQNISEAEWNQDRRTYMAHSKVVDTEAHLAPENRTEARRVYIEFPSKDEVANLRNQPLPKTM